MAPLTAQEQATVDTAATMRAHRTNGTRPIGDQELERAELEATWAVRNAEIRAARQTEREAAQAAEAARTQEAHAARVQAAQDAYKRQARLTFPGSDQDFEQAWPEILKVWQLRQLAADESEASRSQRTLYRHF
jgi:hypothetical protein